MKIFNPLLLFLILAVQATSCQQIMPKNPVPLFFNYMNEGDFVKISEVITQDFTIVEGDQVLCSDPEGFYTLFQWDSVFNPSFEILEIESEKNKTRLSISKTCKRIEFLNREPLRYIVDVYTTGGKISRMETQDYIDTDFRKWSNRRDKLVQWTRENHPEIPGFIIDISIEGAQNYILAINLFIENRDK